MRYRRAILFGICFVALLAASFFGLSTPAILWNGPGLLIVVCGTLCATFLTYNEKMIAYSFRTYMKSNRYSKIMREQKAHDFPILLQCLDLIHKGKIPDATTYSKKLKWYILREGLELVIDDIYSFEDILETLNYKIKEKTLRKQAAISTLKGMASYAPAFGMMGTLFGLIDLLSVVSGDDMALLTQGMATAMMTTLYGILISNLIFKPMAKRIEQTDAIQQADIRVGFQALKLAFERKSISAAKEFARHYYSIELEQLERKAKSTAQMAHAGGRYE